MESITLSCKQFSNLNDNNSKGKGRWQLLPNPMKAPSGTSALRIVYKKVIYLAI